MKTKSKENLMKVYENAINTEYLMKSAGSSWYHFEKREPSKNYVHIVIKTGESGYFSNFVLNDFISAAKKCFVGVTIDSPSQIDLLFDFS